MVFTLSDLPCSPPCGSGIARDEIEVDVVGWFGGGSKALSERRRMALGMGDEEEETVKRTWTYESGLSDWLE